MISASATAEAGTRLAGFQITALPKANAGAIFHTAVAVGKFHGLMIPTVPTGSRRISTSTVRAHTVRVFAELAQRFGAVIGEELPGAIDLALTLGQRLAFLAAEKLAEFAGRGP